MWSCFELVFSECSRPWKSISLYVLCVCACRGESNKGKSVMPNKPQLALKAGKGEIHVIKWDLVLGHSTSAVVFSYLGHFISLPASFQHWVMLAGGFQSKYLPPVQRLEQAQIANASLHGCSFRDLWLLWHVKLVSKWNGTNVADLMH